MSNRYANQKRPRKTPTLKQKLFAKKYVENKGNGVKAASEVYDGDYTSNKSIAVQNLQKPVVQLEIQKEMEKAGLTGEYLTQKVFEGIEAGMGVKATQKDTNQLLNMAFKLLNAFPTTKHARLNINVKSEVSQKTLDEVLSLGEKSASNTQALLKIFKS